MFRPEMLAIFMVAPKAVTLQVRSGPEGCRKLRLPVFMTTVRDSGKFVTLIHLPSLTPLNAPGTHFLLEDSPPQYFRSVMFWTGFGDYIGEHYPVHPVPMLPVRSCCCPSNTTAHN